MRSLAVRTTLAFAALAALAVLASCEQGAGWNAASREGPLLVIGVDGAEWSVLEPLLEAGELPTLSRLIETGASGRLRSFDPRQASPVIWTTIATGLAPEDHGITHYLTSAEWRAGAFWDICGDAGQSVGVVAWLVTSPAWPVNGFMVSEAVRNPRQLVRSGTEVYPPEVLELVAANARPPDSATVAEMARFVNTSGDLGLESLECSNGDILSKALSGDETAVDVTLALLESEGVRDLTCVYLRGVDEVCHAFWLYMDAASRPAFKQQNERSESLAQYAEALGGLVDEYYRYTDEQIGRILERYPDDTTVLICSDHGFRGPGDFGDGPKRMLLQQHGLEGVVILNGPRFAPGTTIEGATVYDIAPTVLAFAGRPIGRDMPGRVLVEAFIDAPEVTFVESHGGGRSTRDGPVVIDETTREQIRERLRSLGYIQ
jgi:predicted AlkP superfamily phosphohydrolase/phosphomutase